MSNRGEILDSSQFGSENGIRRGLLYSDVLGWLDMGHARGDDVRQLMAQFSTGEAGNESYYRVRYEQTMGISRFTTGRFNVWEIKKGELSQKGRILHWR